MNQSPSALEIPAALVRDYQQINRELTLALDHGHRSIRLTEVEGQRLLAAGLRGTWSATIEIDGNAGPELAAGLDAPGLTVVCHGSAADGAGRGLRAGRLAIAGNSGDALGAEMGGGVIVVRGSTGHRAGLRQRGGVLVLLGSVGRLLADRQSGGLLFARPPVIASADGRNLRPACLLGLPDSFTTPGSLPAQSAFDLREALADLPEAFLAGPGS